MFARGNRKGYADFMGEYSGRENGRGAARTHSRDPRAPANVSRVVVPHADKNGAPQRPFVQLPIRRAADLPPREREPHQNRRYTAPSLAGTARR